METVVEWMAVVMGSEPREEGKEVGTEADVAVVPVAMERSEVAVLGYSKNMDRSRVRLPW